MLARAGWTIIDKLYLLNGTLYIVTDKPDSIPDRNLITSTGINIENGAEAWEARHPTDKEMRIVTPQEAKAIFGPDAQIIDGVSVRLLNDLYLLITDAFAVAYDRYASIVGDHHLMHLFDDNQRTQRHALLPLVRRTLLWLLAHLLLPRYFHYIDG